MSLYDATRTKPYYGELESQCDPEHAHDRRILKWWSPVQDALIPPLIDRYRTRWSHHIVDEIVRTTADETLKKWRATDPKCRRWNWENILMFFARARAMQLGFTNVISQPVWRTCVLCRQYFREDSLPQPLTKKLGLDDADYEYYEYCPPCLINALPECGDNAASEEEIKTYIHNLAETLQSVPYKNFGLNREAFVGLTSEERLALLTILQRKPTPQQVTRLFRSWINAAIKAGVMHDATQYTGRGIRCVAMDGHLCYSLAEKTIDDFLYCHGIEHEKEPRYPEGRHRADFLVADVFIEYFGLLGDATYDAKIEVKKALCRKHRIQLISLTPKDLVTLQRLEESLGCLLP